jgi:hypothetical protein
MGPPLYIKKLATDTTPGLIVVLDTETMPEIDGEDGAQWHKLRLGVAIAWRVENGKVSRRREFRFTTANEFWDWLFPRLKPRQPLWLFAHNLGFDLTVLEFWKLLEQGEYGFTRKSVGLEVRDDNKGTGRQWSGFLCAEDPPTIINCIHKTGGRLTMVDTLNYFRVPLSELGEATDLAKMEMPEWSADDDEWFEYCARDAEILEVTVSNLLTWWKTNKLGKFGYTAASLAIESYRRQFIPQWIELHHEPDIRRLEREAYYGGRLELFFRGKVSSVEKITELDINGLYPFIMEGFDFPYRLTASHLTHGSIDVSKLSKKHIAQVKVRALGDGFPYRCKLGLIFPRGEYWTTLCGPELMRAVEDGCILEVGEWSRYSFADLFGDFVRYFWSQRLEYKQTGDKLRERFAKLVMNSLYGKFGQRFGRWENMPYEEPMNSWGEWVTYNMETNTIQKYRGIGNLTQASTQRGEHGRAFPAISAYVTSHAREYMRKLYHIAGAGHVFYMVTDSLFVDRFGLENLERNLMIDPDRLGALKVKHQARTAEFDALHWWRLGRNEKRGSLKATAIPIEENQYQQTHFSGLRETLKARPGQGIKETVRTLRFDRSNRRGTPDELGWITPLYIDDDPIRLDLVRRPTAS